MTPMQRADWELAATSAVVALWALYCGVLVNSWMFVGAVLFAMNACLFARRAWRGDR